MCGHVAAVTYFRLRDYGTQGQIGMEATPAEFVATLVDVFEGVRRVLRPDGVLFVNLGDSYSGSGKGPSSQNGLTKQHSSVGPLIEAKTPSIEGVRPKSLFLIPQRFAIAMQDAGWIVRQEIVWAKRAPMPESVRDRCTSAWEPIYMFTKEGRYYWDQDAVRQPNVSADDARNRPDYTPNRERNVGGRSDGYTSAHGAMGWNAAGANLRNVWDLSPEPSRENHYAAFPTEIPRRCILAATSEKGACADCGAPWARVVEREPGFEARRVTDGGLRGRRTGAAIDSEYRGVGFTRSETTGWRPTCTHDAPVVPCVVLDPFLGSGTTALVADQLGRNAIGIELNAEYVEISRRRIAGDAPMFADVVVAS